MSVRPLFFIFFNELKSNLLLVTTNPPCPLEIVLAIDKEKQPISEKVPAYLFLLGNLHPKDWAASSIT